MAGERKKRVWPCEADLNRNVNVTAKMWGSGGEVKAGGEDEKQGGDACATRSVASANAKAITLHPTRPNTEILLS